MGCLLSTETLIYILSQSVQSCMQYDLVLARVITAPDCISSFTIKFKCCRNDLSASLRMWSYRVYFQSWKPFFNLDLHPFSFVTLLYVIFHLFRAGGPKPCVPTVGLGIRRSIISYNNRRQFSSVSFNELGKWNFVAVDLGSIKAIGLIHIKLWAFTTHGGEISLC